MLAAQAVVEGDAVTCLSEPCGELVVLDVAALVGLVEPPDRVEDVLADGRERAL